MKFLSFLILLALVGCGKTQNVFTPDHKGQIDSNTTRIDLLEKRLDVYAVCPQGSIKLANNQSISGGN